MYNAISRHTEDPTSEFNGLWLNETTGALYVWSGKPIKVGFSKDFVVVTADVFNIGFVHTPKRNDQDYLKKFEYNKMPLKVIADVKTYGYEGGDVDVCFGSLYAHVEPKDGIYVLGQNGNVALNGEMEVFCEPTRGRLDITLYVISYE